MRNLRHPITKLSSHLTCKSSREKSLVERFANGARGWGKIGCLKPPCQFMGETWLRALLFRCYIKAAPICRCFHTEWFYYQFIELKCRQKYTAWKSGMSVGRAPCQIWASKPSGSCPKVPHEPFLTMPICDSIHAAHWFLYPHSELKN